MNPFKPTRPLHFTCQLRIQYSDGKPDLITPWVTKAEAGRQMEFCWQDSSVKDAVIEPYGDKA